MPNSLSAQVGKLLNDSMVTDIRSKFGFAVPKDVLEPLVMRASNTIFCALEQAGEAMVYMLVDHYEDELKNVVVDVVEITGEPAYLVRRKIEEAVDALCNKLYQFIQTWRRVQRLNDAHHAAQNPRKTHHDSRQARNRSGQHFTR